MMVWFKGIAMAFTSMIWLLVDRLCVDEGGCLHVCSRWQGRFAFELGKKQSDKITRPVDGSNIIHFAFSHTHICVSSERKQWVLLTSELLSKNEKHMEDVNGEEEGDIEACLFPAVIKRNAGSGDEDVSTGSVEIAMPGFFTNTIWDRVDSRQQSKGSSCYVIWLATATQAEEDLYITIQQGRKERSIASSSNHQKSKHQSLAPKPLFPPRTETKRDN